MLTQIVCNIFGCNPDRMAQYFKLRLTKAVMKWIIILNISFNIKYVTCTIKRIRNKENVKYKCTWYHRYVQLLR